MFFPQNELCKTKIPNLNVWNISFISRNSLMQKRDNFFRAGNYYFFKIKIWEGRLQNSTQLNLEPFSCWHIQMKFAFPSWLRGSWIQICAIEIDPFTNTRLLTIYPDTRIFTITVDSVTHNTIKSGSGGGTLMPEYNFR